MAALEKTSQILLNKIIWGNIADQYEHVADEIFTLIGKAKAAQPLHHAFQAFHTTVQAMRNAAFPSLQEATEKAVESIRELHKCLQIFVAFLKNNPQYMNLSTRSPSIISKLQNEKIEQ